MDDLVWFGEWKVEGNEDGGVSIQCPYCAANDLPDWIILDWSIEDGYVSVTDMVNAAVLHQRSH
jgi:hypothetical protein